MIDIACVGVIVADAIAKPVKIIPSKGKLELVDTLSLYTGGCAASAAIDMAKIGIKAAIIGKIGNDGFGNFMKNAFVEKELPEGYSTLPASPEKVYVSTFPLVVFTGFWNRCFANTIVVNESTFI